nr:MAG TPA: hypothetical protein [Caudoviricetes sp.]
MNKAISREIAFYTSNLSREVVPLESAIFYL